MKRFLTVLMIMVMIPYVTTMAWTCLLYTSWQKSSIKRAIM